MISGANVQKTLIPPNIFLKKFHILLKKEQQSEVYCRALRH